MAQRITEIPVAKELLASDEVYIKQGDEFLRIPLDVFWNEIIDARKDIADKDGSQHTYGSLGEFLRAISASLKNANFDIDLSNLDLLEEDGTLYLYDSKADKKIGEGWTIRGGSGGGTGAVMKLVNLMGATTLPVAYGNDCTIRFRFTSVDDEDKTPTGDGSCTYSVNGSVILTQALAQGECSYTIPKGLLAEGTNTFQITVTDAYGTSKSLTWTLAAKSISVSTTLDDTVIFAEDVILRYTPTGADIEKTTHFELDGTEIGTAVTSDTNIAKTFTIPKQSHGAHTLKVWTSATIGGVTVSSTVLVYHLLFADENNTTPVISVKAYGRVVQYSTVQIPYMVYDALNNPAAVTLMVNGVEAGQLSVDRSLQQWAYKPVTAGSHNLSIICGDTTASFTVEVEASAASVTAVTDGLLWTFEPAGRSNAELNRGVWEDGNIKMTIPDTFHWGSGGWGTDEEGIPCFTVPAGDLITISSNLFSTDFKRYGHLFKVVFKSVNVRDYDAQVLSCLSENIGLTVQAQVATLRTGQTTMQIPLCEDTYTELEFNISSSTEHCEMVTWINGIPSAVKIYAENDGFVQPSPVPISIGSPDCDVRIYKMREYSTALTDEQIFQNWIADAPSGEARLARWNRNRITDDYGNIDPDRLASVCPDLRVITLTCSRFTTGKEDTVQGCTVRHVLQSGGKTHCWTANGVNHKGQGTSSEGYGDSGRNLDLEFLSGFDLDDGTHIDNYAMTDQSIGINYFNLKVNVASSESANNAMLTREYQRFNPYIRPARQADSRVRDTMEFHPCALFIQDLSGELFGDTKPHFYCAGDLGNSKKNFEAQGLSGTNENECIVEIMNNTDDVCRYKSDVLTDSSWKGDETSVEFRYPKNGTDSMKAAFQRLLSWVVATDTTTATDALLDVAATYGGTVYRNDSVAYRKAKFIHEFDDYFISDSAMWFYLFTERHAMVDNRAKNTFLHTEDGLHWDFCFDYDNDTAMGNDNEGGLTLSYGMEDTDQIGTKDVFNAADSVLWKNIRDLFPDRLSAMFQRMETAGAWSASRLLKEMEEYQAIKPERLWIADMRRKYFRPYEDPAINTGFYLPMMHGTKVLQRRQFETYQEVYIASKYVSAACTADKITLRGYTPTNFGDGITPCGDITLTMYQDAYIAIKYGSHTIKTRVKRGVATQITAPEATLNDTEIYLYSASRIQSIGSLAALYVGVCDFSPAVKLQSLVVSDYDPNYSNTNITDINLGNCRLLKSLSICGCPNMAVPLSFNGCPNLEILDIRGSGITGVSFAVGGRITTAQLSNTVTSISGKNLESLVSITMQSYKQLRTLHIENCPAVNSLEMVTAATELTRVRLIDVSWQMANANALVRLSEANGIDDSGFDITTPVVTGEAHVTTLSQSKLNLLSATFANLAVTYTTISPEYVVRFLSDDGNIVLDEQIIEHGYPADNPYTRKKNPIPVPSKEATDYKIYTFSGWSGLFTQILQDTEIRATFDERDRYYTIRFCDGVIPVQIIQVIAGGNALYSGPDLVQEGFIWTGWDKEVRNVLSDMDVTAIYEAPALPAVKADTTQFDYIYSDDPKDNAAYKFGEFVGIVNAGLAHEYFNMYDKVKILNHSSVITDTSIVLSLHSFGHYQLPDKSALANTTWYMPGLLSLSRPMNSSNTNVGGYFASKLDKWIEETLYPALPCHWRSVIKPVWVLANAGNLSSDIVEAQRHLYLPSVAELGLETNNVPYKNEVYEGANEKQFSMYTSNNQRIKKTFNNEGTATNYWTRSAYSGSASIFCFVYGNGSLTNNNSASNSLGVCVGLSI